MAPNDSSELAPDPKWLERHDAQNINRISNLAHYVHQLRQHAGLFEECSDQQCRVMRSWVSLPR